VPATNPVNIATGSALRSQRSTLKSSNSAAAAEFALKAHAFCDRHVRDELGEGQKIMQEISSAVDLTEAPEDALCSLIVDLMRYCARENIDWDGDVSSRALERFRGKPLP
jgi:hypothetical protein